MQLRRIPRRLAVVVAFGLGAAGLISSPAQAQEQSQTGSRYRVLIPTLEHPKGSDDSFGKTTAEALRKQIDGLPTHVSISKEELKDNLRKFKIDEKDLDCVKSRQLAVQIGAELVMCGSYEPAGGGQKVTSAFVGAKTGETFDVPAFTAATPADAAKQIFSAFQNYVNQLRALAICQQYLGSQQWANALQNCNQALAVNAQSATALYYKSMALMNMDSLTEALATLRQVIKINPMHSDALRTAGVVAAKMDSTALSTEFFRQYLELNPGAASVRLSLAGDAAKAGNPEGALKMVEEGFKADTGANATPNVDLLLFAGHWALQASQKVEDAAQKAGKDKPARADSLAMVALSYYQKYATAKDTAADPNVVKNMILIMSAHNQGAQAAQVAQKYLAMKHQDKDQAGLWSAYADALKDQGNMSQALAALDSAAAYDKTGELPVYIKRGQWLAERGQLAAAKAAFQQAIQRGKLKSGDAASLLISIGLRDHYAKGDNDGALTYFDAARDLSDDAVIRGTANFYTGSIIFRRASEAASSAQKLPPGEKQQAAVRKAASSFREAANYLGQTDAFVAQNPRVRSGLDQMQGYINTYLAAVKKQGGATEEAAAKPKKKS